MARNAAARPGYWIQKGSAHPERNGVQDVSQALGGVTILQKGPSDRIFAAEEGAVAAPLVVELQGAPRRPGGLGDILSGTAAVMLAWALAAKASQLESCRAAASVVRRACQKAFERHQRATVAPDVIQELPVAFADFALTSGVATPSTDNAKAEAVAATALRHLQNIVPALDGRGHKGQAGRVGVLGGSVDYTGAPYFAGMSALRTGAELIYLCTAAEAALPIKIYSPELMVSSMYDTARLRDPATRSQEQEAFLQKFTEVIPRLHALCIGPGLGRQQEVLDVVGRIIQLGRERNLPMVIDADALWLVTQQPDLVKGYNSIVLTPNRMEFKRLAEAVLGDQDADIARLCEALDGPVIVQKGPVDLILTKTMSPMTALPVAEAGSLRRPGGIGDLLAGTISVMLAWTSIKQAASAQDSGVDDYLNSCAAACLLVRRASRLSFEKHGRSMLAGDILQELGPCFEDISPAVTISDMD
eukprot:TRINITY_DN31700_c0_g1_i2.p1 TRINITY_DN31700_c0_g1~~TRINITY_DN31700_c0_g1_i2.p1  ORF type:complete len:474 (+),score=53.31 TRINITY_DN31700_c0_g1_i2:805-2226(+)